VSRSSRHVAVLPLAGGRFLRPQRAKRAAVLPLAGGRFLRPTKEGGGRRERSPGLGASAALAGTSPPPGSYVAGGACVTFILL
jgi:hypothetical protein